MNEIDILEKMAYEPPLYLENAEPLSALHFDKIKAEYRAKDLQKDLKNILFYPKLKKIANLHGLAF